MADVIGVISGILTIFSFLKDNIPNQGGENQAVVRIAAGLNKAKNPNDPNSAPLTNGDGDISSVGLYDEHQDFIADGGHAYIGSGGYNDWKIDQGNSKQATFVQIHAGGNAVCTPYVSVTTVGGSKWGWPGDFAPVCGLRWYYSDFYIGDDKSTGAPHKALCGWLDGDHSDGNAINNSPSAGDIILHLPDFAYDGGDLPSSPQNFCGWPSFRAYYNQDGTESIFKRDDDDDDDNDVAHPQRQLKRSTEVDPRLVVTSEPSHNVTELCAHELSFGPDMANLADGKFCNMETREVLPICEDGKTDSCFDVDSKQVVSGHSKRAPREYTETFSWGS